MEPHPGGSSASSISMLGMSSLMEKRGPHRVQIKLSPSRRRGAFPSGQTKSDSNVSFTMGQVLRPDVSSESIPPRRSLRIVRTVAALQDAVCCRL